MRCERSMGLLLTAVVSALFGGLAEGRERALDLRALETLPDDRDGASYYRLVSDELGTYVHADYQPGLKAVKRGLPIPEPDRAGRHWLRWRWRALTLPAGGDECEPTKRDSAASVYVGWRRGLRWYSLKLSWSATGRRGALCDRVDTPFFVNQTVILETGEPLGTWLEETIDLDFEFRRHFAGGDPHATVPDLAGVALLTDGDQTHSAASADFGGFSLTTLL